MLTFSIWGNKFSNLKSHRISQKGSVTATLVGLVLPEKYLSIDKFSSGPMLPVQEQM